jgi:hypothetical protein
VSTPGGLREQGSRWPHLKLGCRFPESPPNRLSRQFFLKRCWFKTRRSTFQSLCDSTKHWRERAKLVPTSAKDVRGKLWQNKKRNAGLNTSLKPATFSIWNTECFRETIPAVLHGRSNDPLSGVNAERPGHFARRYRCSTFTSTARAKTSRRHDAPASKQRKMSFAPFMASLGARLLG